MWFSDLKQVPRANNDPIFVVAATNAGNATAMSKVL